MHFRTRIEAVAHGLGLAGLSTDPAAMIAAATARGLEIPGLSFLPPMNGQMSPFWSFDGSQTIELRKLVDSLQSETPTSRNFKRSAA